MSSRELNKQRRNILTIMITAYATFDTAVQATKLGGYDFLAKPFTPEELRYTIRKATNQLIINREARRLADEKRQVRFNFISVLSHELKAPINAIEGYLKILRQDETPERQHMIDRSLIRLDGMRKLIFDLLDLTRIESGQKQRNFARWTSAACAKARHRARSRPRPPAGASTSPCGPTTRWRSKADPNEIEIILNNLISNAVKYNRDGGTVTVSIARDGDGAKIAVADTGIGLTPEECAKLFNEFVRIKNDDTLKIMGSGLGLSTVRKLANLYGGDATVKSKKGSGSIFTVTLSRLQRAAAAGRTPPTTATAPTDVAGQPAR